MYVAAFAADGTLSGFVQQDAPDAAVDTVVNDVFRADISMRKVSENDASKVLPNSVYGLYKRVVSPLARGAESLQLIAKATTDEHGMLTFKGVLMDREYVVQELEAPDGSLVSKHPIAMTFAVGSDGAPRLATFNDGSGTAEVAENGVIVWKEPQVMVAFDKRPPRATRLPARCSRWWMSGAAWWWSRGRPRRGGARRWKACSWRVRPTASWSSRRLRATCAPTTCRSPWRIRSSGRGKGSCSRWTWLTSSRRRRLRRRLPQRGPRLPGEDGRPVARAARWGRGVRGGRHCRGERRAPATHAHVNARRRGPRGPLLLSTASSSSRCARRARRVRRRRNAHTPCARKTA